MTAFELDELDIKLLNSCKEKSGQPLKEVLKPFLGVRANRTLYDRLKVLEEYKLIWIDRAKFRGRALCHITALGEKTLAGWVGGPRPKGGELQ